PARRSFVVRRVEYAPHHLSAEATRRQEAGLPGALRRILRQHAEAAPPDLARPLELGGVQAGHRNGHPLGIDALGLQLLPDAAGAEPRAAAVDDRIDHPLLVEEALGLQFVQRLLQLARLGL